MLLYILQILDQIDFLLRTGYERTVEYDRLTDLYSEFKENMDKYLAGPIEEVNHVQARKVFIKGHRISREEDLSEEVRDYATHKNGEVWRNSQGWITKVDNQLIIIPKREYADYGIIE